MGTRGALFSRLRCFAWFLFLGAIGLDACGWRATQVDRSLLTWQPCAPPCWQGITPGVTTREQALEILENSPYVRKGSVWELRISERSGTIWWRGVRRVEYPEPSLQWKDGIVQNIILPIEYDLPVQVVIGRFGPPEGVTAGRGGVPEHYYWIVTLYYPRWGIGLGAYTEEFSNVLEPTTKVMTVSYFPPMSLEERVRTVYSGAPRNIAHELSILRPWRGYGDLFEVYYESPDELFLR